VSVIGRSQYLYLFPFHGRGRQSRPDPDVPSSMNHLLRYLRPLVQLNLRHPIYTVLLAVSLAVFTGYLALKLKVDTDIANLLPDSDPSVQALDRLQESVGGEIDMQVAIVSPSFEDNRRFAEELIQQALQLRYQRNGNPYFERAEF